MRNYVNIKIDIYLWNLMAKIKLLIAVPILDWDVHDVGQWLDSIGMVEYKENFMSNDIRGRELLNLNRHDIKVRRILKN